VNPFRELRALFSPYELAVGAMLFHFGFFIAAGLCGILRHSVFGFVVCAAASALAGLVAYFGIVCPAPPAGSPSCVTI
jgi:hypothetical protein